MTDLERFAVLMLLSSTAFLALVLVLTRTRVVKPSPGVLLPLSFVVVCCGMTFARYGHLLFHLPWWIYYGVPAGLTIFLPPLVLRMARSEVLRYLPSAVLLAPAVHVVASLAFGWHDYMPFPAYIPSLVELVHKIA